MVLGNYPLRDLGAIPQSFNKTRHKAWLWQVETSAFEAPLEPLTQEFWREHLNASLIYGIVLPTLEARTSDDTLVLISESIEESHTAKPFGSLTAAQRYEIYKFIHDRKLPNTEHLARMHHFARIAYLRACEETFLINILPKQDAQGTYRRASFVSAKPVTLDGSSQVSCPKCKQLCRYNHGMIILGMQFEDAGTIKVFCVCEACEQPFIFSTYAQHLKNL
jgi:hypothetical protein